MQNIIAIKIVLLVDSKNSGSKKDSNKKKSRLIINKIINYSY